MTSREPQGAYRTLLILAPECKQWRDITAKWSAMDDKALRKQFQKLERSSSLPAGLVKATSPDRTSEGFSRESQLEAVRRRLAPAARSTYGQDFHFHSAETMAVSRGKLSHMANEGADSRMPKAMSVLVREVDAMQWRTLQDPCISTRNAGRHLKGNQRPYPYVTQMAEKAARQCYPKISSLTKVANNNQNESSK
ncbi:unnamed protein product [Polarella glacialis]|uniref:Uncharacterized protein n=1 Tax=Polarella glacialis TaxID=89957 RepID=A0A813KUE6_POLGL|nr:unnamed protein product [Polarella glacialis]